LIKSDILKHVGKMTLEFSDANVSPEAEVVELHIWFAPAPRDQAFSLICSGVENTSQAEYAGSIPVIGSTKSQFKPHIFWIYQSTNGRFDRGVTVSSRDEVPKPFAGCQASQAHQA
jgi:hypothetical protein